MVEVTKVVCVSRGHREVLDTGPRRLRMYYHVVIKTFGRRECEKKCWEKKYQKVGGTSTPSVTLLFGERSREEVLKREPSVQSVCGDLPSLYFYAKGSLCDPKGPNIRHDGVRRRRPRIG